MGRATQMKPVVIGGQRFRAEWYSYQTCQEVLIRGPFKGSAFKENGDPVFRKGCCAAFKLVGTIARATNKTRSKKFDGEASLDWRPFAEALGYEVV